MHGGKPSVNLLGDVGLFPFAKLTAGPRARELGDSFDDMHVRLCGVEKPGDS